MPVTLTCSPTWLARFRWCRSSRTSIVFVLFFRNPDFQVRDFGASSPAVFFSRNVSWSCTRHPTIVAGSASCSGTFAVAWAAAGFAAVVADDLCLLATAGSGFGAEDASAVCGGGVVAALVGSDPRAVIRIAVPRMQTTMRAIAAVRLPMILLPMKRKRLGLFAGMKSSSGEHWTLALSRKPG